MSTKNPSQKNSEIDGTEKIYITLPKKYVNILEIIAGDPRDKSKTVEKMIDNYIDNNEDTLKRDGKWNKVLVALRGTTLENLREEKVAFIDKWVEKHPDNKELAEFWMGIRDGDDDRKITTLYQKIKAKIDALEAKMDEFI